MTEEVDDTFVIIQNLSKTAHCSVYKALDTRNGEIVAIKIISTHNEYDKMKTEKQLSNLCQSPYIVNVYETFIKDENIWIIMEYCECGSILDIMHKTQQNLTEDKIQIIMKQSLEGLQHFHSNKIVHGNIKAANILINRNGDCNIGMLIICALIRKYIIYIYIYIYILLSLHIIQLLFEYLRIIQT